MSDLLNIGASGVRAYQSALTTVSENIANAGTAGYSRRSVDVREVGPTIGIVAGRTITDGQGVSIAGVVRSADQFKAADVRHASADLARSETGIAWLDRIESALTGNQLGDRLTGFFNAATAIAADPTASTPRSAFLEAGNSVAGAFAGTGKALDQVAADLDSTAQNAVTSLDSLATALTRINDGLGRATPGTSAAAQLQDQRDQLLDQISAIADINVATDPAGRATVRFGGTTGAVLVGGTEASRTNYTRNTDGTVAFTVHRSDGDYTFSPSGGALAGIVDGAQRITDAQVQLDTIASSFTAGVNAAQGQGRDLDGNPGAAIFTVGASATDISLSLTDPRKVAAAAVGGGPRDNSNLKAFAAARTTGAFEDKTTTLVTGNATTLAGRKQVADAQSAIRDGAIAARDGVSGVNLDNEAVDLLRFQQAYSASSRVIQIARDTLQSILDIR